MRELLQHTGRTRLLAIIEIVMYGAMYIGLARFLHGINARNGVDVLDGMFIMLGGSVCLVVLHLIRAERLAWQLHRCRQAAKCPCEHGWHQ